MISTVEVIAFRLLKEAGTEKFKRLSGNRGVCLSYPLNQFGKEIENEKSICEDQSPRGHSFRTNLDLPYLC